MCAHPTATSNVTDLSSRCPPLFGPARRATCATALRSPLTTAGEVDGTGHGDVERLFGAEGAAVAVFDGVVLVTLDGDQPAARAVGEHHLAARLERGSTIGTPEGARYAARRPLGYPALLPHDGGAADPWQAGEVTRSLVAALRPVAPGAGRSRADLLTDLTGTTTHGRWWVARVGLIPPVQTRGLLCATPVIGSRTHLTVPGAGTALCGRVPVRAPLGPAPSADCPACLRSDRVRVRLDAQLAHHDALAGHVGALTAGAAARWWPRFAHLVEEPVGPVGDAAAGVLHHRLPGAPDLDTALALIAASVTSVAAATRRWAAAEVEQRLRTVLRSTLPRHPTQLTDDLRALLATAEVLLDAATLADLLVGAFDDLGPALALEPVTARLAAAAGPLAPDRVQRWLRLHRVAAALGGRDPTHPNGPAGPTTLLLER